MVFFFQSTSSQETSRTPTPSPRLSRDTVSSIETTVMSMKAEVTVTQIKAASFSDSTVAENRTLISRFYSLDESAIVQSSTNAKRIVKSTLLIVETEKANSLPHYLILYCLIFVLILIFILGSRYIVKEKARLLGLISNTCLFYNRKPIYRQVSEKDLLNYLEPGVLNTSADTNADSYETVIFQRSSQTCNL